MNMNTSYYFNTPAKAFEEAFPLGNGKTGAMVYGGTREERISLNSDTVWSGHYERSLPPKGAAENWVESQVQAAKGNHQKVEDLLLKGFIQDYTQKYLPVGNLNLRFNHEQVENYRRLLDMENGVCEITYIHNNKNYKRTCFVSAQKDCIVINISCSEPGSISLQASMETSLWCLENHTEDDLLELYSMCPYDYERAGSLSKPRYLYSQKEGDSVRCSVYMKPIVKKGTCCAKDGKIEISSADEVTLYVVIRNSFIDAYSAPVRECRQWAKQDVLACGAYEEIRAEHEKNFSKLFGRVKLSISRERVDMDQAERLKKFDGSDKGLYELYFHFGRYLMISGSMPGSKAMNLSGIWNEQINPIWSSNYTVNINTQMTYWPTFSCNLAECFEPFINLVREMVPSGRCTAQDYHDARGFVCHHNTDLWAHTAPVGVRYPTPSVYSPWPLGSAWLAEQLFDSYEYTLDKKGLEEIYPIMKEAAEFYLDVLVEENGKLIMTPSNSPENFFMVDGKRYGLTKYTAASQSMIEELFRHVIEASYILEIDEEFRSQVEKAHDKLQLLEIGSDGRLMEWDQEYEEWEKEHRHISHLYALYPGTLVSIDEMPELAEACKKTLIARGDEGTGWCMGWKISSWAFLRDGDHAEKILRKQLKYVEPASHGEGGTYPNLFDACPPFSIDGNLGATAGIANMLLQSKRGHLHLLPALPTDWSEGSFQGLIAKGNITVSAWWENGKVYRMILCSETDQKITACINDKVETILLMAKEPLEWGGNSYA